MSGRPVEVRGLSKRYGAFTLDIPGFHVAPGEVLALLGPNGAGKSTLIRILLGLTRPDRGDVRVMGCPVDEARSRDDVAFVSPEARFYERATLSWHLGLVRDLAPTWSEAEVDRLLHRFELDPGRRTGSFSTGERVRAHLLLALARRPRLVLLDEPTAGLDVMAREVVHDEILATVEDGDRSVLLTTHLVHDASRLADRVVMIAGGQVIESGTTPDLLDRWRRVRVGLAPWSRPDRWPGVVEVRRDGDRAQLVVTAFEEGWVESAEVDGADVLEVVPLTLEEILRSRIREGATITGRAS